MHDYIRVIYFSAKINSKVLDKFIYKKTLKYYNYNNYVHFYLCLFFRKNYYLTEFRCLTSMPCFYNISKKKMGKKNVFKINSRAQILPLNNNNNKKM